MPAPRPPHAAASDRLRFSLIVAKETYFHYVRNGWKADTPILLSEPVQRPAELSLLIALALLSGCWHEAFHSSVDNGTNQTIYAIIHFDDGSIPPAHGKIEPGSGVDLTEKVEAISYIDYRIGERRCRMDKNLIAEVARTSKAGLTSISLTDCAQPDA